MKLLKTSIVVVGLFLCFMLVPAQAERSSGWLDSFILPNRLQGIEESAFEGTNAVLVVLPDSVTVISDRAFANMRRLAAIFIPPQTESMGEDIFAGSGNAIVFGVSGSPAEDWARAHGYVFIHWDIWSLSHIDRGREAGIHVFGAYREKSDADNAAIQPNVRTDGIKELKKPKDNPNMYPVDYDFP